MQPLGERFERVQIQLLRSETHHGGLQHGGIVDQVPEGIAQHFAALAKGGLHDLHKEGIFENGVWVGFAPEVNHAAEDLWRGCKGFPGYRKKVFAFIPGLGKHAEDAVFLIARRGNDAAGHFLLKHAGHLRDEVAMLKHSEKDLAGNIVGEIANQGEGPAIKQLVEIQLQKIALHDMFPPRRMFVVQPGDHVLIGFNGLEMREPFHQATGEDPFAWADLQNAAFQTLSGEGIGYPLGYFGVFEEVLTERLFSAHGGFVYFWCQKGDFPLNNMQTSL